jgi:hypothetical protein
MSLKNIEQHITSKPDYNLYDHNSEQFVTQWLLPAAPAPGGAGGYTTKNVHKITSNETTFYIPLYIIGKY